MWFVFWLFSYVYILSPQLDAEYILLCQVKCSTNAWRVDIWILSSPSTSSALPTSSALLSPEPCSTSNSPYLLYCPKLYFSLLSLLVLSSPKVPKSYSFFFKVFCIHCIHFNSASTILVLTPNNLYLDYWNCLFTILFSATLSTPYTFNLPEKSIAMWYFST